MYNLLKGIRVIDFTHVWQGPMATLMLADLGADVIKIERPGRGDWSRAWGPFRKGVSLPFAGLNRNKRSVSLDIKSDEGKNALERLLATADVVVHNFRPGVDAKMGIDFPTLHGRFPRIVHASASGWGEQGPDAERGRAGHAQMAAAEGGLFSPPTNDAPPQAPTISVDHLAGMLLSNAILAGLVYRERHGTGVQVMTDLHSAALTAHVWDGPRALNQGDDEEQDVDLTLVEKTLPHGWKTADGYIEISPVFADNPIRQICKSIGIEDLTHEPDFATPTLQYNNRVDLRSRIGERLMQKTTAQWLVDLEQAGILCAEIRSAEDALRHPAANVNGMVISVDHPQAGAMRLLGSAIRTGGEPAPSKPPPVQGEHTDEVLSELHASD